MLISLLCYNLCCCLLVFWTRDEGRGVCTLHPCAGSRSHRGDSLLYGGLYGVDDLQEGFYFISHPWEMPIYQIQNVLERNPVLWNFRTQNIPVKIYPCYWQLSIVKFGELTRTEVEWSNRKRLKPKYWINLSLYGFLISINKKSGN